MRFLCDLWTLFGYLRFRTATTDISVSQLINDILRIYIFHIRVNITILLLLTVHLDVILVNDELDALFLNVFISCLYMFRATGTHHHEDQVLLIHHLV